MTGTRELDVVDILTAQHRQIRALLDRLRLDDRDTEQVFDDLVRLLTVHETAEEEVVHPLAGRARFGAERIVEPRLAEESAAKKALSELRELGVGHPEFPAKLAAFRDAVLTHAEHEEAEEFELLRRQYSARELRNMGRSVRRAEALAPTRPHPGTGVSALPNRVLGLPLAVLDRLRDVLRDRRH
ncbi:hemerythrin domain-containing protein [Nocardia bovistercoris]|uniref:Hemerythrin domain-containing protein n=1 Tax=Nocardia bovistercoris TaxID=2785916 RepID=A0A931IK38_9NOCA|nr:hemerythrin domain-containing protein [Nocardia bovistercoris]MBH0781786.1 hemerythrin domain-containing protein [Nocardia bovistercoris]